jgi:hypothetical protein
MTIKANATDKQFSQVKKPELNMIRQPTPAQIYLQATHAVHRKDGEAACQRQERKYRDIDSKRPRSTFGESATK